MHISVQLIEMMSKLRTVSRRLQQQLGREPTLEEIAKEAAISIEEMRSVMNIAENPIGLAFSGDAGYLDDFAEDAVPLDRSFLAGDLLPAAMPAAGEDVVPEPKSATDVLPLEELMLQMNEAELKILKQGLDDLVQKAWAARQLRRMIRKQLEEPLRNCRI